MASPLPARVHESQAACNSQTQSVLSVCGHRGKLVRGTHLDGGLQRTARTGALARTLARNMTGRQIWQQTRSPQC